ncbi:ROK family transcriptional regulator [Lachnospiraceae bacterium NSJ-143]|nr:ROK family transcriptional regulator [Lachnospiraceae bacterium NSJ-143]
MNPYYNILRQLPADYKNILNIIQKKGPISKSEIQEITGLKLTKLNSLMQFFIDSLIIEKKCVGDSTGGRPPVLFDIIDKKMYVLGIGMGSLNYNITIMDFKANLIASRKFEMNMTYKPQEFIELAYIQAAELLDENNIDYNKLLGLGIGTTGSLNRSEGKIIYSASSRMNESWININILELFEEKFQIPCTIDVNISSVAIAEYLYGKFKGTDRLMYLNCAMSIRSGFVSNGRLLRSTNDKDDAFGHMMVNIDGEACSCGNYGCVECYSSIPAIVKKFRSALKLGRFTVIQKSIDEINYTDICDAAKAGDILAQEILRDAAVTLGCGLANYINLLNPSVVIFNGLLINESDFFYRISVETSVQKLKNLNMDYNIEFSKSDSLSGFFLIGPCVVFLEALLGNLN